MAESLICYKKPILLKCNFVGFSHGCYMKVSPKAAVCLAIPFCQCYCVLRNVLNNQFHMYAMYWTTTFCSGSVSLSFFLIAPLINISKIHLTGIPPPPFVFSFAFS